jgi:glyoxylase-like metal-dependent hydrolase (beta-lactamase superfamily II)
MKPVAVDWFQREQVTPDLIRITEKHFDPIARANLWLLSGRDVHLLIDTGLGVSDLARYLAPLLDKPLTVVCTHAHFDHAGGLADFKSTCLHCLEIDLMRRGDATAALAQPEQGFNVDAYFSELPYPGFSAANYRFRPCVVQRALNEGDVVYDGELIDKALGCVPEEYATSMERLARLAPRLVHPGHYHSFDTQRMQALIIDYLAGRREPGCPGLE